jgi:hypothetical protein
MPYTPPSGWIESPQDVQDKPRKSFFHTRRDCARVIDSAALRPTSRPFSATRCTACARY